MGFYHQNGVFMGYHGDIMRTLQPTTVSPIRVSAKICWPKMVVLIAKLMIRHEIIYGKVLDSPNFQPDPVVLKAGVMQWDFGAPPCSNMN